MYRKVIRYVMSAMKIGQNYAQRCITKWTKKNRKYSATTIWKKYLIRYEAKYLVGFLYQIIQKYKLNLG